MTNAAAVSRALKRAGIITVHSRSREGVYVTGDRWGVSVAVQIDDAPQQESAMADAVAEALDAAGYTVVRNGARFQVTR